jgi:hypothetical protein
MSYQPLFVVGITVTLSVLSEGKWSMSVFALSTPLGPLNHKLLMCDAVRPLMVLHLPEATVPEAQGANGPNR